MATPNYKALIRTFEQTHEQHGPRVLEEDLKAHFKDKTLRPSDFDFGRLFEACFGFSEFQECRNSKKLAWNVMEAAGAVATTAFQQISGQIVYQQVKEEYESPDYIFSRLIPERQSAYSGEKIAGITEIGDEITERNEGTEYALAGVGETWQHLAETKSRGARVLLTREAVFFDRTGQLLQRAAAVGKSLAINREKRAVDCVIDENGGAKSALVGGHRYHFLNNSIATYGDNSGNHDWDNLAASNGLLDWTDIDAAAQLLNGMTDPFTGEPIVFKARHLVCAQQLEEVAKRIVNATLIRVATPGYATTGNPTETEVVNPFRNSFEVVTSPYVASRLGTDTSWFYGDLAKAFVYVVNFPMQTKQLAGGTQIEFDRDIVLQYRADDMGNYSTLEPRCMVKSTA